MLNSTVNFGYRALSKGPITPTEHSAKLLTQGTSMGRVSDYIYTSKDETS